MSKFSSIKGHPSVGAKLLDILGKNPEAAAVIRKMISILDIDPNAKNHKKWIDVIEMKEFNKPISIFKHIVYRAKIYPYADKKVETHYRLIFFVDDDLGHNIYLYLDIRPFDDPNLQYTWKSDIIERYLDFVRRVKFQYQAGISNPRWSVL